MHEYRVRPRRTRRCLLTALALAASSALALTACGADQASEAGAVGLNWFKEQLQNAGYVEQEDGSLATPPVKGAGLLLGDALELQIRHLLVTRVLSVGTTPEQRDQGIVWMGQAILTYEYRDRYHRGNQPRAWSDWGSEYTVLTLTRGPDQWYIRRTS